MWLQGTIPMLWLGKSLSLRAHYPLITWAGFVILQSSVYGLFLQLDTGLVRVWDPIRNLVHSRLYCWALILTALHKSFLSMQHSSSKLRKPRHLYSSPIRKWTPEIKIKSVFVTTVVKIKVFAVVFISDNREILFLKSGKYIATVILVPQ